MVTPPAFSAAIPVGATIIVRLCVFSTIRLSKVVLPVPALPDKKMGEFVWLTNRSTNSAMLSVSCVVLFSFMNFNLSKKFDCIKCTYAVHKVLK